MSKRNERILDDEIQIIGHDCYSVPPFEEKRPRSIGVSIISAVIVIVILLGFVAVALWPKRAVKDSYGGVFDPAPQEERLDDNLQDTTTLGQEAESDLCYTEKADTLINDIELSLYIPHNATAELLVGRPDSNDKHIVLIVQAADIRADNLNILGSFVLKGEPLAWGRSKKGFCAIIDGKMTVGISDNSPMFEEAVEKGGYFFRQFPLVDKGALVEVPIKGKTMRKALCQRNGQHFVAVSETRESFHDFAQALVDLGVQNAISLVGGRDAYGWRIDENGEREQFGEDSHQFDNVNYLYWSK